MNTTLSGCQALHGCEKKNECLRYQCFLDQPWIGFHAYQSCKLSEFTENTYPHFVDRTRGENNGTHR